MNPQSVDAHPRINRGGSFLVSDIDYVMVTPRDSDPPTQVWSVLGFRTFRRIREVKP